MKTVILAFSYLLAAAMFSPPAVADDSDQDHGITVEVPWARASAGMAKTGAAYATIKNVGRHADRLIGVRSSVAKKTGIHKTLVEDGVMKMRAADVIEVPAGGMVMLKPGGYHVMFMGLEHPLKEGASFPLTLVFEKAGEIDVNVRVMKVGTMEGMKMEDKQEHNKP